MNKKKWVVVVWGNGESFNDDNEAGFQFDGGEIFQFDSKPEITAWISMSGVRPHAKTSAAGQLVLQLPDGRAALLIHGNVKGLVSRHSLM